MFSFSVYFILVKHSIQLEPYFKAWFLTLLASKQNLLMILLLWDYYIAVVRFNNLIKLTKEICYIRIINFYAFFYLLLYFPCIGRSYFLVIYLNYKKKYSYLISTIFPPFRRF
jgi:hypothetical protein